MSTRWNWTGWIGMVAGAVVVAAGAAAAQGVFSAALNSPLSGEGPGDALPILVLADVGSWAGPLDGHLDLITADQSSRFLPDETLVGFATVWYGNGDGTFGPSNGGTPLHRIPTALAIGDFDGDHIPDLAVTDTAGNVVILTGDGAGSFNAPGPAIFAGGRCSSTITKTCTTTGDCPAHEICSAAPVALAAADVNHDEKLDLVILNNAQSGGWVAALLGDGQGGFTSGGSVDLGIGGSAVVVDDFNRDGKLDLAVANRNTNSVVILRGVGDGSFSLAQTIDEDPNGREPVGIAVGDLNKDGRPDLVTVNHVTDNFGILLGQADGTFRLDRQVESGTMNSAPNGVALLDANGDGNLDIAASNNFSFDVSLVLGDGSGKFSAPRAFVTDQEPLTVAAADLNGDGIVDLVALNRDNTTADAATLLGQGDGTFVGVEDVIVQPSPNAVVAGDADNDGLADLIVSHPSGAVLVRRAQPGGGFAAPSILQAAGDAVAVGRGDFNADGRLDVVALNRSTSSVSLFIGATNGLPGTPQNYAVGAGGVALAVGDWDKNGRSDLAVARQAGGSSGAIDILLSNADGSLRAPVSLPLGSSPVAIDWGDFNKDGNADLAVISKSGTCSVTTSQTCNIDTECPSGEVCTHHNSKLTVSLGRGDGTFQAGVDTGIPGASDDGKGLAVADFDGDGFDDVAVLLAPPDNRVVVLYSDGQAFTADATLTFSSPVWSVTARDISGDSIPDLIVSVQGDTNAVFPYINSGASRLFAPQATVPVSRSPTSIIAADFDGDGRYDAATADSNVAGSVSVLTNIYATPVIRGDANRDSKVSAADLVAVARKLGGGTVFRAEQVGGGTYPVGFGADANGDGLVTAQDAPALAHRLFPRL